MKHGSILFASGLPEDITEMTLIRHFERIDRTIQVRSINIFRVHGSIKARGTALIDFGTAEDAEKALNKISYTEISGKEIQFMWYQPGGIKDRVTGNIFVKNLPSNFKSKDLYELFSTVGTVLSSRVKYNVNGTCTGYGYVQFENKEGAERAIAEINGKEVSDCKIEVGPFKSRDNRNSSINVYNNLFVKGIPKKYTNEDMKKLFEPCGEIVSAVIVKERAEDKENRGFGFVCFKRAEDAKAAEVKFKNAEIEGQRLYIYRALPLQEHRKKVREERYKMFKDCNVYVKNLPEETTDEELKKAFESFGTVISARVMMELRQDPVTGNTEQKSKGFGFVCFSDTEEAKKAIAEASQKQIFGRTLVVAIAEKKEDRIAKLTHEMYQFPMEMYPPAYRNHGVPPRRPHDNRPRQPRPYMTDQLYPYMIPMMGPRGMSGYPRMSGMQGVSVPMAPMPGMAGMQPIPYAVPIPMTTPIQVEAPLPFEKDALGEILYPMVQKVDPASASKITGMLLEMQIEEIQNIIKDSSQLEHWISEAKEVLNSTSSQ